jgi:signal transduction histidine kinase
MLSTAAGPAKQTSLMAEYATLLADSVLRHKAWLAEHTAQIETDLAKFKQILYNLLSNAVKFTPANGEVILQVKAEVEQDLIKLSVSDNGIGIAAQDLRRLFQPFVQVDSSLNRQHEGTGLGLALVQRLTDLHGGSVQVESEVGKGSRFTIELPMKIETTDEHG